MVKIYFKNNAPHLSISAPGGRAGRDLQLRGDERERVKEAFITSQNNDLKNLTHN